MNLNNDVVREDHRLMDIAIASQEALASHRYHWTLAEGNELRVSINAYANAIGVAQSKVYAMVHGYAMYLEGYTGTRTNNRSLSDCIELAGMGAERQLATESIADAMERTPTAIARGERAEIRNVVSAAKDAALRKGTSVADEIPRIAQATVKANKSRKDAEANRRKNQTAVYAKLELRIGSAQRALVEVLTEAKQAEMDDELIDLVTHSLAELRAIINLIDMAISGNADIDWDAEATRLGA